MRRHERPHTSRADARRRADERTNVWPNGEYDYDAYSDMDVAGVWPNGGLGVEDTTLLHGIGLDAMDDESELDDL